MNRKTTLIFAYWLATAGLFVLSIWAVFALAPTADVKQVLQRIFYVHLPMAINTFVACLLVFVASVGYLVQRKPVWDDLAESAARVSVLLCSGVLLTGMIWGHNAWNTWWSWTPRLTFSFMLWLLYVVYLVVRASIESAQRRAVISAVYGIVAFMDVPLVYLSSTLLPTPGELHPDHFESSMRGSLLALFFVPITMMAAGMIAARFGLARQERAAREAARAAEADDHPISLAGGAA